MAKIVDFTHFHGHKGPAVYGALLDCGHIERYTAGEWRRHELGVGRDVFCIRCPPKADHECVHCGQPAVRCWTIPAGPRYCENVWLCRFCDTPAGQLLAQYPNQVDAGTVLAHVSAVAHRLAKELRR